MLRFTACFTAHSHVTGAGGILGRRRHRRLHRRTPLWRDEGRDLGREEGRQAWGKGPKEATHAKEAEAGGGGAGGGGAGGDHRPRHPGGDHRGGRRSAGGARLWSGPKGPPFP
jgi:hypothetical protein